MAGVANVRFDLEQDKKVVTRGKDLLYKESEFSPNINAQFVSTCL